MPSFYHEINFDSRSAFRSLGDNNRPTFFFNDPMYIQKYGIKSMQIPLSFDNCYKDNQIVLRLEITRFNGLITNLHTVNIPRNTYFFDGAAPVDNNGHVALLAALNASYAPQPGTVWEIEASTDELWQPYYGTYKFKLTGPAAAGNDPVSVKITVETSANFSRLLGYHPNETVTKTLIVNSDLVGVAAEADVFRTPVTKFSDYNYLILRSDIASGAHYLPISNVGPNFSMSNALGRYPVLTGNHD